MYPSPYFAPRYFAPRYFPPVVVLDVLRLPIGPYRANFIITTLACDALDILLRYKDDMDIQPQMASLTDRSRR